jgi:hypothetical protein
MWCLLAGLQHGVVGHGELAAKSLSSRHLLSPLLYTGTLTCLPQHADEQLLGTLAYLPKQNILSRTGTLTFNSTMVSLVTIRK